MNHGVGGSPTCIHGDGAAPSLIHGEGGTPASVIIESSGHGVGTGAGSHGVGTKVCK